MQKIFILSGVTLLLVFILGGQYMRDFVPTLTGQDAFARMAWRANHIYLMFAGLLHLFVGLYWSAPDSGWSGWVKRVASLLVFIAGPLLVYAWLNDPSHGGYERIWTAFGLFAVFGGGLLLAVARVKELKDARP